DEVQAAAGALPGRPAVVNLEPRTLSEMLAAIRQVAGAASVEAKAEKLISDLQSRIDAVAARTAGIARRPRVALLEWLDPLFSCGPWGPGLLRLAGGGGGLRPGGGPAPARRRAGLVRRAPGGGGRAGRGL